VFIISPGLRLYIQLDVRGPVYWLCNQSSMVLWWHNDEHGKVFAEKDSRFSNSVNIAGTTDNSAHRDTGHPARIACQTFLPNHTIQRRVFIY